MDYKKREKNVHQSSILNRQTKITEMHYIELITATYQDETHDKTFWVYPNKNMLHSKQ